MKILKFPHKILLTSCDPVTVFDEDLVFTMDQMWAAMLNANGIGLSANQVGILKRYIVMIDADGGRLNIVNPVIALLSNEDKKSVEGCLSAPGELVEIVRSSKVLLKFQDEKGLQRFVSFEGIEAVCIQHEIDHLNGLSFLKHESLGLLKKKKLAKRWGI